MRASVKVILSKEVMGYESVPWHETIKWDPNFWYPLPQGSMWTDPDKCTVIDDYGIFKLDSAVLGSGDITPVLDLYHGFSFRTAVAICEAHNGFSWELDDTP